MDNKDFHLQLLLTSLTTPATPITDEHPTPPSSVTALRLVQQGKYLQALHIALQNLDIASKFTTQPPESPLEWFNGLTITAAAVLENDDGSLSTEPGCLLLLAAVASLYLFTQANLTGPLVTVPESPFDLLTEEAINNSCSAAGEIAGGGAAAQQIGRDSMSLADRWACTLLAENGEDLVGRIRYPQYLLLSKVILCPEDEEEEGRNNRGKNNSLSCTSLRRPEWSWWAMRTVLTQQRILAGRSASLRQRLLSLTKTVLDYYQHPEQTVAVTAAKTTPTTNLAAAALLEAAMMETAYGHVQQAKIYTDQALAHLELHAELGGAMGIRTVHQQDPRAQLILKVSVASSTPSAASGGNENLSNPQSTVSTVKNVENSSVQDRQGVDGAVLDKFLIESSGSNQEVKGLEDESDVLKHPKLVSPNGNKGENGLSGGDINGSGVFNEACLTPLQQAAILALALHAKKGSSEDGLQPWEVLAHADAVLQQPRSEFLVRAAAHLLVTRVERQRSRTRERALLALEGLAEALDRENSINTSANEEYISAAARMRCAFAVWFPLRVSLRKELGEAFVTLGLVGAALPLFENLELWDNLIVCYRLLDKKVAAEQLVKNRLEVTPDEPRLWCALGDLSLEDAHYMEAWERSGKRNARAARSLARNAVRTERYEKAAQHWKEALALNPLHPEGWFHLGWCCIKTKEYHGALRALTRSAQMDPENGEAWNNLAAVHIHLEHWKEAFAALTEAVKHNRNSWHTWDNYAGVAVKVGEWQAAVRALGQVVGLSRGQRLDISVLAVVLSQLEKVKSGHASVNSKVASENKDGNSSLERIASSEGEQPAAIGAQTATTTEAELYMAASLEALTLLSSSSPPPSEITATSTYAAQKAEAEERSNESFLRMVGNLMKQIASTAAGDSVFWAQYARYYSALGETEAAAECLLKRVRALQGGTWRENKNDFEAYAAACLDLSTAYLVSGGPREWSQAKMLLRGAVKLAEERYEDHSAYTELQKVLKQVEDKIQQHKEQQYS